MIFLREELFGEINKNKDLLAYYKPWCYTILATFCWYPGKENCNEGQIFSETDLRKMQNY